MFSRDLGIFPALDSQYQETISKDRVSSIVSFWGKFIYAQGMNFFGNYQKYLLLDSRADIKQANSSWQCSMASQSCGLELTLVIVHWKAIGQFIVELLSPLQWCSGGCFTTGSLEKYTDTHIQFIKTHQWKTCTNYSIIQAKICFLFGITVSEMLWLVQTKDGVQCWDRGLGIERQDTRVFGPDSWRWDFESPVNRRALMFAFHCSQAKGSACKDICSAHSYGGSTHGRVATYKRHGGSGLFFMM